MPGYEYRGRADALQRPQQPQGVRVAVVRLADVQAHAHNVRTDLGDLRSLTDSIREYGVQVPLIVERRGETYRLRDGHRRLAAAKLAGVSRSPAVIHADVLDDEEWLRSSVHLNERRAELQQADRVRTARALAELGVTRAGIAKTFNITTTTLAVWLDGRTVGSTGLTRKQIDQRARSSARNELLRRHHAEFTELVTEHRTRLEQEAVEETPPAGCSTDDASTDQYPPAPR